MKKITNVFIVAIAFIFTISASAFAQSSDTQPLRLGIGLSLGVPTNDAYDFAIGGDLRLQKDFSKEVSGMISVGYTDFSAKSSLISNLGFIPVKAGAKFFVGEGTYLGAELGAGFGTKSGSKTSFLWAPSVGHAWSNGLDLSLRYEGASISNIPAPDQVVLRIAYGFKL